MPDATQSGMPDTTAGALAYVTIIPAIIFLVMEPYNRNPFVKFHAWQSIFLGIAWFAVCIIGVIPILGWIIFFFGILVLFVAWIMCLLKALKGERFKLPIIGNLAERQANS